MQGYFIELSKYGIIINIILFTLNSYLLLFFKKDKAIAGYVLQSILILSLQALYFINLAFVSNDKQYFILYAFIQAFLLTVLILVPLIYENINKLLLSQLCMLLGIGLCIISRLSFNKAVKQYIIALVSLIISMLVPYILSKISFITKLTWLYAFIGVGLLGTVLALGELTHGSKISFTIFDNITFQPSEFVKIIFLFFLAGALKENRKIYMIFFTAIIAGAHVIILVLSRDLGSALIFFVGYVFVVFIATGNYLYLLAGVGGGCAASYIAYSLFTHVQIRVMAWRDPWAYIDNQGWAITQSLFAMGSGSWFGMGLLNGNPKSIPYVDQDFIFSSLCEEMGVLFGICIILICLCCFLTIFKIAYNTSNSFYRFIVCGIGIVYIFQIFLTVGGGINLIPLTGVTLPFISYGGSSCMTSMLMFFIVLGVSSYYEEEKNLKIPVVFCELIFVVLFIYMSIYIARFVNTKQQDMVNNSYNSRQEILLSQNYRGTIYSRDGEVLAETVLDDEQNETRIYPFDKLFSHVVGYSTNGRMGIEAQANYYLINTNTSISNKVANDVAGIKNPGDNVYSTLDVQIQKVADEQLSVYKGAIIVTEAKTGKILAMVSHPNFDPNQIEDIWDSLLGNDESSVLLNRATQGLYPPGSTFKIITSLEYLKENNNNYSGYSFQCNGFYKSGENRINCYHGSNHGKVNFLMSFAKSCNSSFANVGMSLDKEAFSTTLEKLLFNQELPLTFQYSKSSINVSDDTSDYDMIQTSIGQGTTQITPIHLNMITQAIANEGILMKPYYIDYVENDLGNIVKQFKPQEYGRIISKEESEILTTLMTSVVEKGTATKLSGQEYTAAGKTGSAEFGNVKGESHAWFTGFAPAEDPEVCVTIIVEGAGSGGDYAVPIARRIFDVYFREK